MTATHAEGGVFCHQDIRHAPRQDRKQPRHGSGDFAGATDFPGPAGFTAPPGSTAFPGSTVEIVASAQHGDLDAFRTLYDTHAPRLLGYLRALVGDGDAEDVASETWARIHTALPTYRRHRGDFQAWSTAIARNQAITHLRYRSSHHAVPMPPETLPHRASRSTTEHDAAEAIGTQKALALLYELPHGQRKAVLLCVMIGMDTATAARILRKQPAAVRMAVHRGLKALRQRVGGDA
ncbi:MAG: RNA polymerase sigma factor [Catenulispora sp.]|nr:RNA polymerase sigma factor [Catenulispora sp.]